MAKLVQPVRPLTPTEERIIEFKGLNRRPVVAEGEMSDMWNLTSDGYPMLTQRKPRGRMASPSASIIRPLQIMSKWDKIALVGRTNAGTRFWYDGELVPEITDIGEDTRMVSINNKICFFPQKTYLTINTGGIIPETDAYGSLEASVSVSNATVTIGYDYARFNVPEGHGLAYDDAININGTLTYGSTTEPFNTSVTIESVDNNTIYVASEVFISAIGAGLNTARLTATIERTIPDLDHVVEWNNRLWGCNSEENIIYASKLGDPKNWQYFSGTSMDSYYAQQGTDGVWTGVAKYSNHIIFFKENSMCRVYGSSPSSFQTDNTEVFGVEPGSRQSVVTINDTVFYKSKIGIMAYSGGIPYCISDSLNAEFKDVIAGTEKRKYYASVNTKDVGYELLVFDTERRLWHKEDSERFRSCATIGDSLYFIHYDDDLLVCSEDLPCSGWIHVGNENVTGHVNVINTDMPYESEESMEWSAVFGPFDEYIEEHKIYSKLALRLASGEHGDDYLADENGEVLVTEEGEMLGFPRWLRVYISIDEGEWELVEDLEPPEKKGDFIPIVPRRCDRYSIKLEGSGRCDLKSLTRRVRKGSFGRL